MSTLKDKAIKGVFWSLLERFGNQLIQFVIGLILARLLMPEDYGLIGMILVFISLAQIFVEGGFPSALIRKNEPKYEDFSTVFWFNLIIAVVCYILLFFSAPLIADFFNEQKLITLTRVVALNVIINSFGIIQKTILTKALNFKSQATINLGAILISGFIGVYCAFNGYGVWALVIQNLCRNLIMSIAFWYTSKWRPSFIFSKTSFKELFGFGSNLLFSAIINAFSENIYSILIGKYFNAKSLGYYNRANQFQKLPVSSIYGAIGVVSYPVLSELQNNNEKLKEGYKSIIKLVAFTLFPIMTILIGISEPLIKVLLTDKWLPSVGLLQILCVEGAFYPLQTINLDILKVKGRSDLFLKLEVIKNIIMVLTIIISIRWGINGLVWGLVVLSFICYYINSFYSYVLLQYGLFQQIKDIYKTILICAFTLFAMFFLKSLIIDPIIQLMCLTSFGISLYLFLASFILKSELNNIYDLIKKLVKK